MRNPFIPIILFILSGATYFAFIAPTWEEVGSIKEQQESAQGTITQGEELKTLVADISEKVKRFEEEDPQGRIGAILPLEIDEILFLNDIMRQNHRKKTNARHARSHFRFQQHTRNSLIFYEK